MIIHNYGKIPEGLYYEYGDAGELDDYDLEDIPRDIEEIWYWYAIGSYEGSGNLIALRDGKYYLESLSHCSCYGPTEHLDFNIPYNSIEELERAATGEYTKEIKLLIDMIKNNKEEQCQ